MPLTTDATTANGERSMPQTIEQARERVVRAAERHGEHWFAWEVRAGCWDSRNDVQAAMRGAKLKGE